MTLVTEYAYSAPAGRRRADRAVLLAHGAGKDQHGADLVAVAGALAGAGVPSLRFNYPYRTAGRRSPDRAATLLAATREAAAELCTRTKLGAERLVLGGRSMGGRYASLLAGDPAEPWPALGLVLLAYPLHPPGRADDRRVEHFDRLSMPVLFASGTNDTFGTPAELEAAAARLRGAVRFHWIPTADHGFKPKRRESGLSVDDALAGVAAACVEFVTTL
jgi:hypothetical protein